MNKDIMTKAVLLDMQEKMKLISARVDKCKDLRELAGLYREMADLVDKTAINMDNI